MGKFIMRLDDACEKRDIIKWSRMEMLLDKYGIKPLVGIIPNCEDPMMSEYPKDNGFWELVNGWINKGWRIALHGYNHVYTTEDGGINPVNKRSEFAGLSILEQREKIRNGVKILRDHHIEPLVFFAPSHTFDDNTLRALQEESSIRIISDTPTNKPYCYNGFTFVPQQSGTVRNLPFSVVTFCYHPNMMDDSTFDRLESFFEIYSGRFIEFPVEETKRKMSLLDCAIRRAYFWRRK